MNKYKYLSLEYEIPKQKTINIKDVLDAYSYDKKHQLIVKDLKKLRPDILKPDFILKKIK